MRDNNDLRWFDLSILEAKEVFEVKKAEWQLNNDLATERQKQLIFSLIDGLNISDRMEREYRIQLTLCHFERAEKIINELLDFQKLQNSEFDFSCAPPAWKKIDLTGSFLEIQTESDFVSVGEVEYHNLHDRLFRLNFCEFKYLKINGFKQPFMYSHEQLNGQNFKCLLSQKRNFNNSKKGSFKFM